jgi:hypothetical protein
MAPRRDSLRAESDEVTSAVGTTTTNAIFPGRRVSQGLVALRVHRKLSVRVAPNQLLTEIAFDPRLEYVEIKNKSAKRAMQVFQRLASRVEV